MAVWPNVTLWGVFWLRVLEWSVSDPRVFLLYPHQVSRLYRVWMLRSSFPAFWPVCTYVGLLASHFHTFFDFFVFASEGPEITQNTPK